MSLLFRRLVSGAVRPLPVQQPPLPPWDASNPDGSGIVHTTPPPEFQPPIGYDPLFFRGDFNGLTLPGEWTTRADGDFQIVSGRWNGLVIPRLVGQNTTPPTMLMSPMLPMFPRAVQDAWLTESAERDYSHVVLACEGWGFPENGYHPSTGDVTQWAQYLQSWGNFPTLWRTNPTVADPYFRALLSASAVSFYIVGEEIDGKIPAEQLPPVLDQALADCGRGIPLGAHFTANYPIGFPRDTFLTDWSPYNGLVHLMWQADPTNTAGTQGGFLYYARQRVQLGWVGDTTYSNPAPDCRVIAYEMMATEQLYGRCDELYGKLRSLEAMFCPNGQPGIGMVSGFGNGGSYHDGSPV